MALKPSMANSLKLDDKGYAYGKLADITLVDADESEYEREQYIFDFICEGSKKPINMKVWTGTKLNAEKFGEGKNKDYSKLTRLCLQLGLCTETELKDAQKLGVDPDLDLESIKGYKVKFKPIKSVKTRGLNQIDIDTIEIITDDSGKDKTKENIK